MYKVMIVEDEMLVRIGLKSSVDWNRFGMEVAADYPDGQAAWDGYLRDKPDVVITDIRMPRMDGMQLIANIRERDKATRIVVLSCLEEFELARKAMAMGVSGYILKLTMTEEEISETLHGIREELDRLGGGGSPDGSRGLGASLDLIKEKMLKDFLFYGILKAEEFERFAEQSGMRLTGSRTVACTMEVDRYGELKRKFKDGHGHLIKMTLLNLLGEIMSGHKRGEAFFLDETHYLLLFDFPDTPSELAIKRETTVILGQIREAIRTYFNGSVSFGSSGVQSGFGSLPKLHADSRRALERKFWTGPGLMHEPQQPADMEPIRLRLEAIRNFEPLRALLSPMKLKEYERFVELIESGLTEERKAIEIGLFQFVQWVGTNVYDDRQNEKTLLFNITEHLEQCDSLPDMLDRISAYLSDMAEQARSQLQMSGEITKAIQFIKRHYAENISLQTVADHVNLSFGYLSNLFKKELQITFVDYLNRYRIERAKELLTGTQLKSYDIAVQVGFSPEYTYFSKVFKKVTGLNPNEYRRQWLAGCRSER
ncbi:response regulator transcription factor [Cohnella massiliensis]|uniref:response regulator transcription factor n=1 Tax=Cohnella massiliensis TaxID=1816691 RepID=UPI0009BC4ADE|nr:response regulator [Cohnella massiliensis]